MQNIPKQKQNAGLSGVPVLVWVGLAAIIGVIVWAALASNSTTTPATPGANAAPITDIDHTLGKPGAAVTLIEYGDFQCPACASYHPLVKQLVAEYGDRIQFAYRHFPLVKIHDSAELTARAAEAAGLQGKYWEMHNWLYENQLKWASVPLTAEAVVESHARSLGLDMDKFEADMESDAVKARVDADRQGGEAIGLNHTPTFFLNLEEIPNPKGYDEFKALIDEALAENTGA